MGVLNTAKRKLKVGISREMVYVIKVILYLPRLVLYSLIVINIFSLITKGY